MQGDPKLEFDTIDASSYDKQSWTTTNEGVPLVRYDSNVFLTGHSFGGCTVVSIHIYIDGHDLNQGVVALTSGNQATGRISAAKCRTRGRP